MIKRQRTGQQRSRNCVSTVGEIYIGPPDPFDSEIHIGPPDPFDGEVLSRMKTRSRFEAEIHSVDG